MFDKKWKIEHGGVVHDDYKKYDSVCVEWITERVDTYNATHPNTYTVLGRFSDYDMYEDIQYCSDWIGVYYYIRNESGKYDDIEDLKDCFLPIEIEYGIHTVYDDDDSVSKKNREIIKQCIGIFIDFSDFECIFQNKKSLQLSYTSNTETCCNL